MTKQELLDFLRKSFTPIDNIPEDIAWRDAVCMEARASLLIEANCTSERFPAFMQCGRHTEEGWVYPFSRPFTVTTTVGTFKPPQLHWHFDEFLLRNSRVLVQGSNFDEVPDRWTLDIEDEILIPANANFDITKFRKYLDAESRELAGLNNNPGMPPHREPMAPCDLMNGFKVAQGEFSRKYRSRFLLCRTISPYNTPEKVCHFWGNSAEIFDQLKTHGIRLSQFHLSQERSFDDYLNGIREMLEEEKQSSQEQLIQYDISQMVPCSILNETVPTHYHYYREWYCCVFPFKDKYGNTKMQLLKLYDWKKDRKVLIPVTVWSYPNSSQDKLFCVPLPAEKQPLYHLDLLFKPETETIILTDSVELADSNQRNAPADVVFTSFICSPERYEQVDWTPLEDKEVYYLISNHSKLSLEEAIAKAEQLNTFFTEQNLNTKVFLKLVR